MSAYGQPREHRFQGSQVELAWYEWGEAPHPQVLLVHATGFHGRCWDEVVAHLPPGLHVLALDLRGHGRSTKRGPYVWSSFLADLEEFAAGVGLAGAVGVGHSLGGHCITQLAARGSWRRFTRPGQRQAATDTAGYGQPVDGRSGCRSAGRLLASGAVRSRSFRYLGR